MEHAVESIGTVTEPHKGAVGKLLTLGLALNHRNEVGDNLGGMMLFLASEAVGTEVIAADSRDNGNGGVRNDLVDNTLALGANHDCVEPCSK